MTSGDDQRRTSTRDLVRMYALELLNQGLEVTQMKIRDLIRMNHGVAASPNLVSDEIKKFWYAIGPELNARLHRPGIPDGVAKSFDAIWEAALAHAGRTYEVQRTELQTSTDAAVLRAEQADRRAYEAELRLNDLTREVAALADDKKALTEKLDASEVRCLGLNEEVREAERQKAELIEAHQSERNELVERHQAYLTRMGDEHRGELVRVEAAHQQQIERIDADHLVQVQQLQSANAKLEEQAEGVQRSYDHFIRETANARDDAKALTDRLKQELARSQDLVEQLRVQRSKSSEAASELRGRLEATERSLAATEGLNAQLSTQIQQLQAALFERVKGAGPAPASDDD